MSKSIHWTLLGWTGFLLASVLGAFAAALYDESVEAILGGVDRDLVGRAQAIGAAVELDPEEGWEIELSDDYVRGLGVTAGFCVWAPDGRTILAGEATAGEGPGVGWRTRDDLRIVTVPGSNGTTVEVSRSIAPEQERLRNLAVAMAVVGPAVLLLGLLGGWWLVRRVLAPVETLAAEAAAIGPRDLTGRLNVAMAPLELRVLATAFNATLDRVEEALRQEQRFTQDASHELRTPLAVIRTQAEHALRGERDADELRAALHASLRAAGRMTEITDGLLALARADSGGAPILRNGVSLEQTVSQAVEALNGMAVQREVTLTCDVQAVRVNGDRGLLADAVSNLVENGLRYNRPSGRVDVRLRSEGGCAVLTVSDTGIGIPAEARIHIFERFYRVDPARSRRDGGAGLGLAITRWIVEAHAGDIGVGEREGGGTVFTVRMPAAPPQTPAPGSGNELGAGQACAESRG